MPRSKSESENLRHRRLSDCSRLSPSQMMWRSIVISSQDEFKKQGWNLAGSNLLALAVGLANRHYLYVRPLLVPKDFGCALVTGVIGTLLASLIAYLAFGTTVLPQMAALGCVLGLMGKSFTKLLIENQYCLFFKSILDIVIVQIYPLNYFGNKIKTFKAFRINVISIRAPLVAEELPGPLNAINKSVQKVTFWPDFFSKQASRFFSLSQASQALSYAIKSPQ